MRPISEVMTRDVAVIPPDASLQRAAELLRDLDLVALPVCHGSRLMGMITDRDIVVRAVAQGLAPTTARVADVMSTDVPWVFEDEPQGEVLQLMGERQAHRLPVVSREMELVGMVSISDLGNAGAQTAPAPHDPGRQAPPP
ncbi:CBS domain-containing protein [Massilia solisilvae]|uniref:CBS domain-containing protein n=1 Tax=Massilia solisilvae TaxID=1811225 RepID=A0ABT2BK38_9BURK|nr:CBS domain-containing protein [Massilia solisilvae]MCS0608875.1 CBS domain-containing protein [Massilia solisilvae]